MKKKRTTARPILTVPPSMNNPFLGHWRITKTERWGREALDLLAPAFIRFEDDQMGGFQLIAVRGGLDCRFGERDGMAAVEFTWDGDDDGEARCGRGCAVLRNDQLEGRLYFHGGDDSWFVATRAAHPARS